MRAIWSLAAVTALSAITPRALASDLAPIELAKVGHWEVNYDVDSCHLFARFGTGNDEIDLNLTRDEPQSLFDLTLYGRPFDTANVNLDVAIAFEPLPGVIRRTGTVGVISEPRRLPLVIVQGLRLDNRDVWGMRSRELAPVDSATERSVNAVTIHRDLGRTYRLLTGSLGAPMQALRECTVDLVRSWGFEPDVQARLTKRAAPLGNLSNWLKTSDYPANASAEGHNGLVTFRLDVDELGKVTGCRVLYRTNPDDFSTLTCALLRQRARMSPASDAQWKPVKSYYIGRVRWMAMH